MGSAPTAVGLNRLGRHPAEISERLARTQDMPLKGAAGAQPDPSVVAAFFKEWDPMTPEFSQRLWMNTKSVSALLGGDPLGPGNVGYGHSKSVLSELQVRQSALPSPRLCRPVAVSALGLLPCSTDCDLSETLAQPSRENRRQGYLSFD